MRNFQEKVTTLSFLSSILMTLVSISISFTFMTKEKIPIFDEDNLVK